jgi:hypothetical protein
VTAGRPAGDERRTVGLCADCRWARRVASGRGSLFFLCRRAETDPAYARYPRLPRLECPGYEPDSRRDASSTSTAPASD